MNKNDMIPGKTRVSYMLPGSTNKEGSGLVVDFQSTRSEEFVVVKDDKMKKNINIPIHRINSILERKMTQDKKKLLENFIRREVRKSLNEESETFDFIAYMKDIRTFLFDMERRDPSSSDVAKIIKKLESSAKILRKEYANGFGKD